MRIRRAGPHDAATVDRIVEDVYIRGGWASPDTAPEYVRSLLDATTRIERVLLAEANRVALGTVTATQSAPLANIARARELEIRMLGVLDGFRRRGVGSGLVRACEDLARDRGMHRVVLSTEPAMHAAQGLYVRLGYTRTPDRDWEIHGFRLITYARDLG
jgi:ribosomal protein S18 acetylase RimI-like enzyme